MYGPGCHLYCTPFLTVGPEVEISETRITNGPHSICTIGQGHVGTAAGSAPSASAAAGSADTTTTASASPTAPQIHPLVPHPFLPHLPAICLYSYHIRPYFICMYLYLICMHLYFISLYLYLISLYLYLISLLRCCCR